MFIFVRNILEASFQDFYKDKPGKLCVILTKIFPLWDPTEIYGLLLEFVATEGRKTYLLFSFRDGSWGLITHDLLSSFFCK